MVFKCQIKIELIMLIEINIPKRRIKNKCEGRITLPHTIT